MLATIRTYLDLIRFSHTLFALPFALSSAALAWKLEGHFLWLQLVGILLCMVFARSAAMAFNRLVDHRIDAANPRTLSRHLPAGILTPTGVALFTVACSLGFILSTTLFLITPPGNPWPLLLSVPVLAFIAAYSWTKRFTFLCHFWLGASLFLAPVAAWIAIRGLPSEIYPITTWREMLTPGLLGLAVLLWVSGFDILYACQDEEFDRKARLHSIPARFGVAISLRIAMLCHLAMIVVLLILQATSAQLGWIFLAGVLAVATLLLYEHSLVRPGDLSRVNQAFFQVNAVISIGLLIVVLLQIVFPPDHPKDTGTGSGQSHRHIRVPAGEPIERAEG
ncbi:MAG: UbiA-like polyprenyltransferase [Gemmataceae bacterium]